jgi:hypothetical protein
MSQIQWLHAKAIGGDHQYLALCVPEHTRERTVVLREQSFGGVRVDDVCGVRSIDGQSREKAGIAFCGEWGATEVTDFAVRKAALIDIHAREILATQHCIDLARIARANVNC